MPKDLPHAIGIKEAGNRRAVTQPISPWALNVDGKPVIPPSRAAAEKAIADAYAAGARNVDVGCMQISLKHHGHTYATDPVAAGRILLDPGLNTRYGTWLLARLKRDTGSWTEATRRYHNANPAIGTPYMCGVADIIARLKGLPQPLCGR